MARILVVEDSPDIRVLVRMLLEAAGHEVATAGDGQAGVEEARRQLPDLILMDLSLPLLSGWEATRELKSDPDTAEIPVVAVTAHAMQGDRARALAAGCDGFIPKPIEEGTFAPLVASFLNRRPEGASGPSTTGSAEQTPSTARILVVDDNDEVLEVIRRDLEVEGYEVFTARSSDEALAQCQEKSFDLAVVDVMLAGDSGYRLTSRLIASCPDHLPVLLVTAGTIDRERGYEAGADDFIGKPIESAELKTRVRSLIRTGHFLREQGRAARQHAEAYEKLVELDRLKSDFLSTVSHELRTPLNTIILLAHLIEREGKTPADEERRLHDVGVIRESAETLLRMINNILDLAKLEAGQRDLHPQRIDVESFLREMTDLIEPQIRDRDVSLFVERGPNLPAAAVLDREKVSRVLINLLTNAVKNTQQGRIVLRCERWQDSWAFEVEDTGTGIPENLIAAAFEPFRQIRTSPHESVRGTGLGLPISKQLVELMGGDLMFESREGEGTRVSFTLPELAETEETDDQPARWDSGVVRGGIDSSGRPRRVLVVEDDDASRYGLKSLLESEGYRVAEAASLAQAEAALARRRPDVVVLDITLPDGDGAEWLRQRQKEGPIGFPVIALTGVTADEDRRRIEQAGVGAVLQKPVNVTLLFEALRGGLAPQAQVTEGGRREAGGEKA
jgi:CheY-like chemotaxis protein